MKKDKNETPKKEQMPLPNTFVYIEIKVNIHGGNEL